MSYGFQPIKVKMFLLFVVVGTAVTDAANVPARYASASDAASPKFVQPFSGFSIMKNLNLFDLFGGSKEDPRVEKCEEKGGKLVNSECYEFFSNDDEDFDEARDFCIARGGDLWTPDFTDPFLLHKLFKFLPAVAGTSRGSLWVGATVENGRIIDLNGNDVTNTFGVLVSSETFDDGECLILELENFEYRLRSDNCNANQEFICEYPINIDPKFTINKTIFNW